MGVPITFMDKYNPEQFEIIGIDRVLVEKLTGKINRFFIDGQRKICKNSNQKQKNIRKIMNIELKEI